MIYQVVAISICIKTDLKLLYFNFLLIKKSLIYSPLSRGVDSRHHSGEKTGCVEAQKSFFRIFLYSLFDKKQYSTKIIPYIPIQ